jgi:hypothetical protein
VTCLRCQATTTNGLALCDRCQQTFRVACVNVAAYFTDVDRIRPGQRVKVRSAYQSTPPPIVEPPRDPVSNALDHVATIVFGWCRNLEDDRPGALKPMPATTATRCAWLEAYTATVATLEWAGLAIGELLDCERQLCRILDRTDTGRYVGICGNEVGRETVDGEVSPVYCERHLYATDAAWVTCPECGRAWDAGERQRMMLEQARAELAPVRVIARVVVQLTEEASVERLTRRIEQWVQRGQLRDYGVRVLDGKKPRRVYRIDDVLKLVTGEVRPQDAEAC